MITLGIDTSNYTTSVALFDGKNHKMSRKILDVKKGMRGVRQSDGVFIHNRELPLMIKEIVNGEKIDAVGVSVMPRNVYGSYMPVFTVGNGYAVAISSVLGVNCYEFSHQDGHIMAGIYSLGAYELLEEPFISVHLSGGTTEILKTEYNGYNFNNKIIGGTLDISAGQLIDRVGVNMGLKFPCGKTLEELALKTEETISLPLSIKGAYTNLSGVETKLLNDSETPKEVMARSLLEYISKVLVKTINNAKTQANISKILIAGGVASNSIIRDNLISEFGKNICFASKELSSDNAVGVAVLAYKSEEKI